MLYPSIDEILKKVDSRYTLISIVSKRARQLVDGSEVKVEMNSSKPVSIALQEVAHDKVDFVKPDPLDVK